MSIVDPLIDKANREADNLGWQDIVIHKAKDKVRKWNKPRNTTRAAISILGAAIPIPGVGLGVDVIADQVIKKTEQEFKKRKHNTTKQTGDQSHKLKHNIKHLDLSSFDRARDKVGNEIGEFNMYTNVIYYKDIEHNLCELSYDLVYHFKRARIRNDRLRIEAEIFKKVAEEAIAYCDQNDAIFDVISPKLTRFLHETYKTHEPCGSKDCVAGRKPFSVPKPHNPFK